jgi:nucleotide-binding universal stress UspA family protein
VLHGDDPAIELARFDREHPGTLLCMTTTGRTALGRLLFGSVSRIVVSRSDQAQVVVGPRCRTRSGHTPGQLLVCLDGSRDAESILRWAERWHSGTDLELVLVHIMYPVPPPEARVPPSPEQTARLRYVRRVADRLAADGHRVAESVVQHTDVREAVFQVTAEHPAGMIAVATGHPSPLGEMVVGSTAAELIRWSPTPVLVASRLGAADPVALL